MPWCAGPATTTGRVPARWHARPSTGAPAPARCRGTAPRTSRSARAWRDAPPHRATRGSPRTARIRPSGRRSWWIFLASEGDGHQPLLGHFANGVGRTFPAEAAVLDAAERHRVDARTGRFVHVD